MRLIDADALKQGFESSDFDDDPSENVDNACRIVNSCPTIPAIPVAWLETVRNDADEAGDLEMRDAITNLIDEWHGNEED